jgi:hypothetical protein
MTEFIRKLTGDPHHLRQACLNLLAQGHQVLDDPERRRQVLYKLSAPLCFADSADGSLFPIRTDPSLNYFLWCYFEQGDEWSKLIALFGGYEPTLKELLDGYEFRAFAVQGQWHLDLLTSANFCNQFRFLIKDSTGICHDVQVRLPWDWLDIADKKSLELLSVEMERFRITLGEWFDEVKEEIGAWLANQYEGLNPTRKGFIQWFCQQHGILNFRLALDTLSSGLDVMILQFEEKTVEAHFEPFIHRYCQARLRALHADSQPEKKLESKKEPQAVGPLNATDTIRPLFASDDVYEAAVGLLRACQPPFLHPESTRWIGKRSSKSALIVWVEVLEQEGLIVKESNRARLARCLMNTFEGLSMDTLHASLWEKRTTTTGQYELVFRSLVKKNSVLSAVA